MTYIEYLNKFNQWLESNPLPVNSQLMFFKFLNVFNRAGWPEYVQVDTLRLMMMIDTTDKRTAYRSRDMLVENKLIEYIKGSKSKPSKYKIMLQFATEYGTQKCTESCTKNGTESSTTIKTKTKTKNNPPISPQGDEGDISMPKFKPDVFEKFYKAYPRKAARANAVKAWDKLKPNDELCHTMAVALKKQMKCEQWQDKTKIPHPATWLNGQRWLDEIDENGNVSPEQPKKARKYRSEWINGEEVVFYE